MSSSILRFWGVGVRSWRNFLLLLIAVREFEDSDFLLRVQMVLFHYAWRLNNVFWEWTSFVVTLSQASWSIFYLWEKQSDWKTFSYTFLRPGWIVCCIRNVIFCFRYFFLTFCQWHYYLISICDIHKNTH